MKGMLRAFGIVALLALSAFLGYEALKVRAVLVIGAETRPSQEVVTLSGISVGDSMLKVDKAAAEKGINAFAYYECEGIDLNWPDQVTIRVRERKLSAYILYMNSLIAIDRDAIVLELSSYAESLDKPVVTGLISPSVVLGKKIAVPDESQLVALSAVLKALDESGYLYAVSEINVANVMELKLITMEGLTCVLGTSLDLAKKVTWVKTVVPQLLMDNPELELSRYILDVSSGNSASFLPLE